MLNVLLESKAQHTRRVGGTLTSALVHGAIITGAVLLTVQSPQRIDRPGPEVIDVIPFQPAPMPEAPRPERTPDHSETPTLPHESMPLPTIDHVPTTIPVVDPTAAPITTGSLPIGPALPPAGVIGGPTGLGGP